MAQVLFKLLPLCWDCKCVCAWPFQEKSLSFLQPLGSPGHKPHWYSKTNVIGADLPGAYPPVWSTWCGAKIPHSSGRRCTFVVPLLLAGWAPGVWVLIRPCTCPFCPSWYGFLFLSQLWHSCSVSLQSFSERVALYIVVVLVCLWEEVSPWFFYTAIFTPPNSDWLLRIFKPLSC